MAELATARIELLEAGISAEVRQLAGKGVLKVIDSKARVNDLLASLKDKTADTPLKEGFSIVMKYCAKPLIVIVMAYIWLVKHMYAIYLLLPYNVLQMIFGLGLCFFGGVYFTSIAAVEALINFGGVQLWAELSVVYKEGCNIVDASAIDDTVDADHNGIADVEEMSRNELLSHKASVAMVAVQDPQRFMKALEFFMAAYLSVIATLRFEFARTVALCLGIANMFRVPLCLVLAPPLAMVMGPKLHHWVETIIMTTSKVVAIVVACYIQSIISAFYSGIRGGQLFAIALIHFMVENGFMDRLSCVQKPFDANKSYLDEVIAYPLAAVGFLYQWHIGFSLAFPLDIVLLPCTIVEWILRWEVFGAL